MKQVVSFDLLDVRMEARKMWPELGKVFSVGTKKALYAN